MPVMITPWLPGYERIDLDDALTYTSTSADDWKKVDHSMEGSLESCIQVFKADPGKASHFALSMDGRKVQFIAIHHSAKSLRNLSGGVQTNRDHAIQTELEGFTNGGGDRNVANWSDGYYRLIAQHHVDVWEASARAFPLVATKRRWDVVDRMTPQEYDDFAGICAHRHVPENDHTDVPLDIAKLMRLIADIVTGGPPVADTKPPFVGSKQTSDPTKGEVAIFYPGTGQRMPLRSQGDTDFATALLGPAQWLDPWFFRCTEPLDGRELRP